MSTNQALQPTAKAATEAAAKTETDFERLLQKPHAFNVFGDRDDFVEAQRMAKALASSNFVPDTYKGEEHIGDCLIALDMSNRTGMSVLAVMQNLYQVHGRPAWSSQFLIASVNQSKRFSPIRYWLSEPGKKRKITYNYTVYVMGQKQRKQGEIEIQDRTCLAWAVDRSGERLESPPITMEMAVKEGWVTKDGSKWQTMPELMLRYRAATLFARLYAPELTMGLPTDDEVQDFAFVSPVVTQRNPNPPATIINPPESISEPSEERLTPPKEAGEAWPNQDGDLGPAPKTEPESEVTKPTAAAPGPFADEPEEIRQARETFMAVVEGVPFDDFKDYAASAAGFNVDISAVGGYEEIPGKLVLDWVKNGQRKLANCRRNYRAR